MLERLLLAITVTFSAYLFVEGKLYTTSVSYTSRIPPVVQLPPPPEQPADRWQ
jgi:hypothetical protein